jgi:phosphoribosylformylglycinamidine (FGAM) synthase PurS component
LSRHKKERIKVIEKVNKVEAYNHKKVGLKFVTELEKMFHKKISTMRVGEKIDIEIDGTKEEDRKLILKAVKKSCLYNNIEVHHRWSKDKKKITLIIEGI